MAHAKDPLNPPRPGEYDKATPEEIAADIERTRAHMDQTLEQLGRTLRPRIPAKAALTLLGPLLGLAAAAILGTAVYRGYRRRHSVRGRIARFPGIRTILAGAARSAASTTRKAGLGEQALLAARIALATRGGKTAILVVEPRSA